MERRSTGRAIEQAYQKAAMLADTWQLERSYEYWSGEEGCVILTGWVRDGYSPNDIAKNIGVSRQTLDKWIKSSETMQDAIRQGSDLVNYRVENALLKSALGYKTKNVTVTTIMRYGKVVEEQRQGNNDLQKGLSRLICVASGWRLLLARQLLEGTSDYRSSVSGISLH